MEATGPPGPVSSNDLELGSGSSATMTNPGAGSSPKPPQSPVSKLKEWMRPSDKTIYNAILGTADGMTVPFAVMASLAGAADARLVMLAGLAELIAGAVSMGASGILGAKSDAECHESDKRETTERVLNDPDGAAHELTTSLVADLPTAIISDIQTHYQTLLPPDKAKLILRFKSDPDPCSADTYKTAFTFFICYFSGIFALIPYIIVPRHQVYLAFYSSIAITAALSFAYGWVKTGYNVGFTGLDNVVKGIWGGVTFFSVVAVAAALSVVIIRGIDHEL